VTRKIFGPVPTETQQPAGQGDETPPAATPRADPLRMRPLMGISETGAKPAPVGAIGASLSQLSARTKQAEEIEKRLAAGTTIVELDTSLIEPSFVADRMPLTDEALADLVEAIRANTQLSPVLVRPHPGKPGHYQTAFGHRRIRAVSILERPVRAIVRELTDEEMVVAQGQENNARKDLSYIEKARFAERLATRFSRDIIMQALSVYKGDLSNMLAVAHRIPEDLSNAIGPAPKTGRRGWIELAELFKNESLLAAAHRAVAATGFGDQDSDERFKSVLAAVKQAPLKARAETWSLRGKPLARIVSNAQRVAITIDRKQAPGFADFVLTRLQELYAEHEKERAGGRET